MFRKNNYGLPGLDLTIRGKANIYVWGNSFVEGRASRPELLATSVLMAALQARHPDKYQVLNLGTGGQPPYYGLYKLKFWARRFPPDYVLLVLEDSMLREAVKSADSIFTLSPDFGKPVTGLRKTAVISLCAISSFANVINFGIAYAKDSRKTAMEKKASKKSSNPAPDREAAYQKIESAVLTYEQQYGDRLMLYSLLDDKWNRRLAITCAQHGISFAANSRLRKTSEYHLQKGFFHNKMGRGHFNSKGHRALGEELFRFFERKLNSTATGSNQSKNSRI